jgi:SpoIID/LytB domain protein
VRILIKEFTFADKPGLAAEQERWRRRGLKVRVQTIGSVFGVSGKVIDNRRNYLLLEDPVQPQEAHHRQELLRRKYGTETTLFEELKSFPTGTVELLDTAGRLIAQSQDRLVMEIPERDTFTVRLVEFGIGYDFHGFEDRSYRGSLEFIVDRNGKLAVVNLLSLENLLKGLVPAEIFASAPLEALKAQAVTARGEVLAKIGTKHLADPYVLCAEQHCAVYRGISAESAETNAAVDATRGVALFSSDGRLVDSVYSAVCGGHTENNEVAWTTPPNPNLRGKPDLLHPSNVTPQDLAAYLSADLPAACRLTSFSQPSKFRWERRFTAQELDHLTAALGVGAIRSVSVIERGVSGRARSISLVGETGNARIQGELNIRRTFGMLNSSMFIVTPERSENGKVTGWVFRGGGWGHGVGMCQTGAIGRAEAGQDYAAILRHYFSGAEPVRIY